MIVKLKDLPLPPSINEMYLNNRGCRGPGRIKSPAYRSFERLMFGWKLKHSGNVDLAAYLTRGQDWLQVDVQFCFPRSKLITKDGRPKRHDVDNRLKALNDAVSAAVGFDDCRIATQLISKVITGRPEPYVNVTIARAPQLAEIQTFAQADLERPETES